MHIAKFAAAAAGFPVLCLMSSWFLFQTPPQTQAPSIASETAEKSLDAYKMHRALDFLNRHAPDIDLTTDIGKKRLDLLIEQYSENNSPEELILLYEAFPRSFDYNEPASFALAKSFLVMEQPDKYRAIRNDWKGHERKQEPWFFMDVEALIMEQRYQEAIALLNTRRFNGEAETDRLVRIALLHLTENPKLSWKYLSEASEKDPDNPALNTFKAHLLESVNKHEMALTEHIAAVQKKPEDPTLREQLADFCIRTHQYPLAMEVLTDSLAEPSSDSIWLKTLFLNRVASPAKYSWNSEKIPQGELAPLVNYLIKLPPGVFWNTESFNLLPLADTFLTHQQETFWLRLLMALKNNQDSNALDLLEQNPFQTVSWMPKLELQLKGTLYYRKSQQLASASNELGENIASHITDTPQGNKETDLDVLAMMGNVSLSHISAVNVSKALHNLIQSKEIFAALFLSAGWDEAALQLHTSTVIPPELPEWIAIQLTKAIRRNRGEQQALQFAQNQKATPELSALIKEFTTIAEFQGESPEAKAFLARKAFEEQNWSQAKILTEMLIKEYPDNALLKNNLSTILAEEKKQSDTKRNN